MTTRLVYMTASDETEALKIAKALVEENLVACVNILGPVRSIYRWEGTVHDEPEVAFVAKTTADREQAIVERVAALHSYENPCVVFLPIEAGALPYLSWVREQTSSD